MRRTGNSNLINLPSRPQALDLQRRWSSNHDELAKLAKTRRPSLCAGWFSLTHCPPLREAAGRLPIVTSSIVAAAEPLHETYPPQRHSKRTRTHSCSIAAALEASVPRGGRDLACPRLAPRSLRKKISENIWKTCTTESSAVHATLKAPCDGS